MTADQFDQWCRDNGEHVTDNDGVVVERRASCVCAHNTDGSVTTMLCPLHAKDDPCGTMASVTGKRRRGSIVRGVCSACGWSAKAEARESLRLAMAHWNLFSAMAIR